MTHAWPGLTPEQAAVAEELFAHPEVRDAFEKFWRRARVEVLRQYAYRYGQVAETVPESVRAGCFPERISKAFAAAAEEIESDGVAGTESLTLIPCCEHCGCTDDRSGHDDTCTHGCNDG